MKIDCTECAMYRSEHCRDCLVTFILHPSDETVEVDEALDEPLQTLAGAGLIPTLRFRQPQRHEATISEHDQAQGA